MRECGRELSGMRLLVLALVTAATTQAAAGPRQQVLAQAFDDATTDAKSDARSDALLATGAAIHTLATRTVLKSYLRTLEAGTVPAKRLPEQSPPGPPPGSGKPHGKAPGKAAVATRPPGGGLPPTATLRSFCRGHKAVFTPQFRRRVALALAILRRQPDIKNTWPAAGSLIAVLRHNLLATPWDDDLDFAIAPASYERLRRLLEQGRTWDARDAGASGGSYEGGVLSFPELGSSLDANAIMQDLGDTLAGAEITDVAEITATPLGKALRAETWASDRCHRRFKEGSPPVAFCEQMSTFAVTLDEAGAAGARQERKLCVSFVFLRWGFATVFYHTRHAKGARGGTDQARLGEPEECVGPGHKYADVYPKPWVPLEDAGQTTTLRIEGIDLPVPSGAALEDLREVYGGGWRSEVKLCRRVGTAKTSCADEPAFPLAAVEGALRAAPECREYAAAADSPFASSASSAAAAAAAADSV